MSVPPDAPGGRVPGGDRSLTSGRLSGAHRVGQGIPGRGKGQEGPPPDGILLLAFGGPTKPGEARAFVEAIVGDRPGARERIDLVVSHYEALGGASPMHQRTVEQGRALASALESRGIKLPVAVGMRQWEPRIKDVVADLANRGHRHLLALILAAFRNDASWESYEEAVGKALEALGGAAPRVQFLDVFCSESGFLAACATRVDEAVGQGGPERWDGTWLVFSAHSLPRALAQGSPYVDQFAAAARQIAAVVGAPAFKLAYQSGAAPPPAWVGPDINDVLSDAAREGVRRVVVSPIGFVCDHVEVLYDLDIQAAATAREVGVAMLRVPTVGSHPKFVGCLADVIARKLTIGK